MMFSYSTRNDGFHTMFIVLAVSCLFVLLAADALGQSADTFQPPKIKQDRSFGANIQRTMTLLSTSTPEKRNAVKVLVYGQSISQQNWWKEVAEDLRTRFPHADLTIENRAIGGFSVPLLSRPAEHDVFPFYPDLIIFHVYGGQDAYEAFIREIRSRTTAEMMICNDHLSVGQPNHWHDPHSEQWLPKLSQHYGLEFVNIRAGWRDYLAENKLDPKDLLTDNVHLNDLGCRLMAALIKPHLVVNNQIPAARWDDLVKTQVVGQDVKWEDGKLRLQFRGNRVEAILDPSSAGGTATLTVDDKNLSEVSSLYAITRPSSAVGVGWPAITRVGYEKTPVAEDWVCRITKIHQQARDVEFEVVGSVTGPDGNGRSTERFVSRSGRVVIEKGDWYLEPSRRHARQPVPDGFEIKWSVYPMFVDRLEMQAGKSAVTLLQGIEPGLHTMQLVADGTPPQIKEFRIYNPPLDPSKVPEVGLMPEVKRPQGEPGRKKAEGRNTGPDPRKKKRD